MPSRRAWLSHASVRLRVKAGQRCSGSAMWAGWKSWDFACAPFIPLFIFICFLFKGNPCPLVQPPINGKIEPSQAKYTFKDQVVISCNTIQSAEGMDRRHGDGNMSRKKRIAPLKAIVSLEG